MKIDLNAKQKKTKKDFFTKMIDCNSNLSPLIFMTTLLNRYHQMELTFYFTMLKLFKRVVRENFCSYLQKFSISNDRHPESGK